jgi:hypothetical protein
MGYLSDVFDFEAFNLKDMWKKVKKDPERLLIGAVDPASTKMWNGITGKDYEPLVDQMGGAYGGHTISAFGNNDGGVYGRAEDAGIDTGAGGAMHDVAHVVSAIYGGQGLMNIGGAPAGGQNLGVFSNGGTSGMGGVGGGNAGALAQSGAIEGGAGMGSATSAAPSSMGCQDYAEMAQNMGGQQQPQGRQQYMADALRGQSEDLERERQRKEEEERRRQQLAAALAKPLPNYSPV